MSFRRSSALAPFQRNAILQLIAASGVGLVLYGLTYVSFVIFTPHSNGGSALKQYALGMVDPNVALAPVKSFGSHWWTLLTYGWAHPGFFVWLSNMIWLYAFGSIVQSLVGYRQVIPLFVYGLLGGGAACLLSQLLPSPAFAAGGPLPIMGAGAGVMAMAAAAVTFAPSYRVYIGEHFSIPIMLVFAIYLGLNFASYAYSVPMMVLFAGGLLTGSVYGLLMKRGYRPGAWVYRLGDRLSSAATPPPVRGRSDGRRSKVLQGANRSSRGPVKTQQQRVDDILEKIHQRGYSSLSQEEKDVLLRASQETKE